MATEISSSPPISSTSNTLKNQSSPLYLSSSDSPSTVLVTQILNSSGDNYSSWRRSMQMALNAKNKYAFVTGATPEPDSLSPTYFSWIRCNDMVSSWILNSISRELANTVLYIDTAAGIWKELAERCSQGNAPCIFQIQKAIVSLSQGQNTATAYYSSMKALWDEVVHYKHNPVCSCGAAKHLTDAYNLECVIQFLMGLNDSYSHICSQISMLDPVPSINKVLLLVLQEERQRDITSLTSSTADTTAFFTRTPSSQIKSAAKTSFLKRDRPMCSHCGFVL